MLCRILFLFAGVLVVVRAGVLRKSVGGRKGEEELGGEDSFIQTLFENARKYAETQTAEERKRSPKSVSLHGGGPTSARGSQRPAVWISAFPRSGSSTVLSMVRTAGKDEDSVFSLFEPCHNHDVVVPPSLATNCPLMVGYLADCNFSAVKSLWGWHNRHTSRRTEAYSPDAATRRCRAAEMVAFKVVGRGKTQDPGRRLKHIIPVVRHKPHLRVLDVVRDPRAVYASWKKTEPFPRILAERDYPLWKELCDTYADNFNYTHPQIFTFVFEDLVRYPETTMKRIFSFLGLQFGRLQFDWMEQMFPKYKDFQKKVRSTEFLQLRQQSAEHLRKFELDFEANFNSTGCAEAADSGDLVAYSDCNEKPRTALHHWRKELSEKEKENFASYSPCSDVFKAYGFPV